MAAFCMCRTMRREVWFCTHHLFSFFVGYADTQLSLTSFSVIERRSDRNQHYSITDWSQIIQACAVSRLFSGAYVAPP